ncbi:hypothetical protein Nepgr_031361 [Nepenthes gracilis]|uniref:Uncharacterized protein n=1 Tax=Nepenthes gracilis TaxID=150966 RepID=A0AAD3Y531_NEPGR|nr:hypothetical protein Nepgr_031361 [Nepenthes gracilis]
MLRGRSGNSVEIRAPKSRGGVLRPMTNSQKIREHLDLLEEARDAARIRTAAYQHRVARYYNKKMKAWQFDVGDLVLRGIEATSEAGRQNKLSPTREGPFLVSAVPQRSIQTRNRGGKLVPRA